MEQMSVLGLTPLAISSYFFRSDDLENGAAELTPFDWTEVGVR